MRKIETPDVNIFIDEKTIGMKAIRMLAILLPHHKYKATFSDLKVKLEHQEKHRWFETIISLLGEVSGVAVLKEANIEDGIIKDRGKYILRNGDPSIAQNNLIWTLQFITALGDIALKAQGAGLQFRYANIFHDPWSLSSTHESVFHNFILGKTKGKFPSLEGMLEKALKGKKIEFKIKSVPKAESLINADSLQLGVDMADRLLKHSRFIINNHEKISRVFYENNSIALNAQLKKDKVARYLV